MRANAPSITFLARSLGVGGTERQLITLARGLRAEGCHASIVTFYDEASGFETEGLPVLHAGKSGRYDIYGFVKRLRSTILSTSPDLVHSYLVTPNIASALMKRLIRKPLIWDLRASDVDLDRFGRFDKVTYSLAHRLAKVPDKIVVNSRAGLDHHASLGYPRDKMVFIHNGIDTETFKPDPAGASRVRSEWRVPDHHLLVGLVGRDDPLKDHATFLTAAAIAGPALPDVSFACVGTDAEWLTSQVNATPIRQRTVVAGKRSDMPAVYSAFDLVVSSSMSEGFPNVLAEAMACGTPCIGTDAGDSRLIIGDDSKVVPVKDVDALAALLVAQLKKGKQQLIAEGSSARARVTEEFSVGRMVESYQHLYEEVIARCAASADR